MSELRAILAVALAISLAWLFWRSTQKKRRRAAALPEQLFSGIASLLKNKDLEAGEAAGTWQLTGTYCGKVFQLKAITDTLGLRKLPSLWLMVTLPDSQPVSATIDLMMRPQGPSTFSNFDFLPHTLPTPNFFPEDAVIRSDVPYALVPEAAIRPTMHWFKSNNGKELLISPKGLRIVLQAAEADRARYGVFREARFDRETISQTLAQQAMDKLIAIAGELKR